jgi:hypothetical protein
MSVESFRDLYEAERLVLSRHRESISRGEALPSLSEVLPNARVATEAWWKVLFGKPAQAKAWQLEGSRNESSVQAKAAPSDELLKLKVKVVKTGKQGAEPKAGSDESARSDMDTTVTVEDLRPTVSPGRGVPFVSYVPDDLVALCSSGGGIRSAIFNLGVLQGLGKLGLLPLIDYHSTVSGGGYIGGWWTTWRTNHPEDLGLVPTADEHLVEAAAIRRLREHSRFLSPTGFALSAEFWRGAALWAFGLIGTLLMATSVVAILLFIWAGLRAGLLYTGLDYRPHVWILVAAAVIAMPVSEVLPERWRAWLRTIGVTLFLGAGVALGLDGLWALAVAVQQQSFLASVSSVILGGSGSLAIRWMAGWFAKREESTARSNLAVALSRTLPQIVAVLVIASIAFLLMLAELYLAWRYDLEAAGAPPAYSLPLVALAAAAVFAFLGQIVVSVPSTLHRFYSGRIEEAFLQVPTECAALSTKQSWPSHVSRPLHVVNCCASDTCYSTADQMDRRGTNVGLSSVGAYPSGRGVMPEMTSLSLSEAITASAAAVDPCMGFYSAKLGRLVAFVLFAFNLRLGTWWKPNCVTGPRATGVLEYLSNRASLRPWREMLSQISLPAPDTSSAHPAYGAKSLDLRLTDGGHFDNLAAYEMIRRRCRYVVICDGGADPGYHFTELSSLQRLVRRDFGVEIEIDLDPLRVATTGLSIRHVAVGHIRYPKPASDASGFSEDGVLIYVKPTLTGDEPEDVTQYQSGSSAFPHETTTDQFFDDNQWEAYRKLGEHSITTDLKFVHSYLSGRKVAGPSDAARVFDAAVREFSSEDHRIRTGTSTVGVTLEDGLRTQTKALLDELFPELCCLESAGREVAREALMATIAALDAQEKAFYQCNLNRHGDHLENWGLENRTDRLAASADIRSWWPVLASLYSIPFRNQYLGVRYGLNSLLPLLNRSLVVFTFSKLAKHRPDADLPRSIERVLRVRGSAPATDHDFVLHASWPSHETVFDLGALAFTIDADSESVLVGIDDLQVAPGFWSVGVNALLIDELLESLGFEVDGSATGDRSQERTEGFPVPQESVRRVVVRSALVGSKGVRRPDQRSSWVGRGFVQTRSGRLVRDQKSKARAGLHYSN